MVRLPLLLSVSFLFACSASALAQQTTVHSPFNTASQSFSENIGVQWGFRFPGGSFQFGGPPPAAAQGGAQFGTRFGSGDTGGYFRAYAGQSASTNLSSGSASVTVGNGQTGSIFEGRQVPFVLGLVPVVGDFAGGTSYSPGVPYAPTSSAFQDRVERLRAEGVDLTAPRGNQEDQVTASENEDTLLAPAGGAAPAGVIAPPAGSVEDIARAKAAADSAEQARAAQEIETLISKAEQATADSKPGLAKVYLQMAYRRASGEQKTEIAKRLRAISQ
jgi:hypothetical protein